VGRSTCDIYGGGVTFSTRTRDLGIYEAHVVKRSPRKHEHIIIDEGNINIWTRHCSQRVIQKMVFFQLYMTRSLMRKQKCG
jgi:hypothetical protein